MQKKWVKYYTHNINDVLWNPIVIFIITITLEECV